MNNMEKAIARMVAAVETEVMSKVGAPTPVAQDLLTLLVEVGGDENGVVCNRYYQHLKVHWRCIKVNVAWTLWLDLGTVLIPSPPFVRDERAICDICGQRFT